jgi:uncharacterized membrane protein
LQSEGGFGVIEIENVVVIDRPIEDVFAYVADFENVAQWAGPVTEAKKTSEGPVGVGSTFIQVSRFLGRKAESTIEVTEYAPHKKISQKSSSGPILMETSYILEAVEDGTKVTLVGEVDAAGFFKLAEPVLARILKRQVKTDSGTLKELLEAQS